jgi:ATP-dependent protease ClpP protease subunit
MKIVNRKGETEIMIYEEIGHDPWFGGGVGAKDIASVLKNAPKGDDILVRLNSPGGDAFEGMAIYNQLVQSGRNITTQIDGMAFSAASFIFMAGPVRRMAENAVIMIHEAWGLAIGTATEMRNRASLLEELNHKIADMYVGQSGQSREDVDQWMADETWITIAPEEEGVLDALDIGFATEMVENLKVAARFDPHRAHVDHVPKSLQRLCISPDQAARANIARMNQRVSKLTRLQK